MPSATVSTVDLGVECDHARLDQVGRVRPDDDEPEQLAVARLVDRLHPADRLVLHHRARVRDPREPADRDLVAVLLARLRLGQADAGDLGIGVDRARHRGRVDDRVVAAGVLGRDLALAERGVGELPVAGAVADRVDVRDAGAAMLVGRDPGARVELDPGRLEPDAPRRAAPRPTATSIRSASNRFALAEADGERAPSIVDLRCTACRARA